MRLSHRWVAVGLACTTGLAEEICGIPKHGPSADALKAFEKIQAAVGIKPGTILLYASSDQLVKKRSGAVSTECPAGGGEERWIVYDPELVKGDALYFALAHETAHHMNSDPISGETPGKQQELTADYFAAKYLTRPPLNWTTQKLAQVLTELPLPKDATGIYPSIEERRAQVNAGYAAEYALRHPNEPVLARNGPKTQTPSHEKHPQELPSSRVRSFAADLRHLIALADLHRFNELRKKEPGSDTPIGMKSTFLVSGTDECDISESALLPQFEAIGGIVSPSTKGIDGKSKKSVVCETKERLLSQLDARGELVSGPPDYLFTSMAQMAREEFPEYGWGQRDGPWGESFEAQDGQSTRLVIARFLRKEGNVVEVFVFEK
jgi:hypothetical protein